MNTAPKIDTAVEHRPLHEIANDNRQNTRFGGHTEYASEREFLGEFLNGLQNDVQTIMDLIEGLRETRLVEDSIASATNKGRVTECAGTVARLLETHCCLHTTLGTDDDHWSPEIAIEESIVRKATLMKDAIATVLRAIGQDVAAVIERAKKA